MAARLLVVGVLALALILLASADSQGQPTAEAAKKANPAIRLPDGTYLFTGNAEKTERVELSAEDWRKLLEQLDQLKKQQGARKPMAPSECRLSAKVEKRGDLSVVAIRAIYEFRIVPPQTAIALGGRRAFPTSASLDGHKLPVLETTEDGLLAVVEAPGAHTLTLDLETPVTTRGQKGEIGFEIGLPRAAITRFTLDLLPPGVKRVNLTTRTPDPTDSAKPMVTAREPNMDVKLLASRTDGGRALGAIESLEVTWDPPAAAAPTQDAIRAADWEITANVTDTSLEASARLRLQGFAREWKFVVPTSASVSVERSGNGTASASDPLPSLTRFENSKSVWKVDFATGSSADWVIAIETKQTRPKAVDSKGRAPFPLGPFTTLDVFRQTGSVKLIGSANSRFVVKHGAALRQIEAPVTTEENETAILHRLATGPTGSQAPTAPLLEVETRPLTGRVIIRPAYRLKLTEAGWRVAMDLRVTPIRNEIDQITMELPTGWPTPDPASPLVDVVLPLKSDSTKNTVVVKLASGRRNPFEFTLSALLPVSDPIRGSASLLLPRFPQTPEGDALVTAEVPAGKELRGTAHEWEGDKPSGWANPLTPVPGTDGKVPKTVTAITGRFDQGLARIDLSWQPHRPELLAEIVADVDVQDRQIVIEGELRLRSPDALVSPIHCRGPEKVLSVPQRSLPFAASRQSAGEWDLSIPASAMSKDGTSAVVRFAYVLPLPVRTTGAEMSSARTIPVGLFWPAEATRVEATLRIWPTSTSATGPVLLSAANEGWRTLPPEPVPDRLMLPGLTLHGSGSSLDLVLRVQSSGDLALASGQVDRALVEVSGREASAPLYRRGLFRVRRWFSPTLDVEVPGLLPEAGWSVFVDQRQVSGAQLIEGVIRVPLPSDAERGGPFVVEVRYRSTGLRGLWEAIAFEPPRVRSAAYAGPTRWLIDLPADGTPLVAELLSRSEQRWQWHGGLPRPLAAASSTDLTRWVRDGTETEATSSVDERGPGGEAVVLRQSIPEPLLIVRVPRLAFQAICSLLAFAIAIVLTRLPGTAAGSLTLVLAGLIGTAAVMFPQPASQAAAAALPGLLAVGAVFVVQGALRIYRQYRITNLPGFTRVRIDPPSASTNVNSPYIPPSARVGGASKATTGLVPQLESGPPSGAR